MVNCKKTVKFGKLIALLIGAGMIMSCFPIMSIPNLNLFGGLGVLVLMFIGIFLSLLGSSDNNNS